MYNYYTNQQSFGATLNINNLKYREHKLLGGKKRWMQIKNLFQEGSKNDKNSYILETHWNHQGLATIEMFKRCGKSKKHVGGFGGGNYMDLVSLPTEEIPGKLLSLIG